MVSQIRSCVSFVREHPYQTAWVGGMALSVVSATTSFALYLFRSQDQWYSCSCDWQPYPTWAPLEDLGICVGMNEGQRHRFCMQVDMWSTIYITVAIMSAVMAAVLFTFRAIIEVNLKSKETGTQERAQTGPFISVQTPLLAIVAENNEGISMDDFEKAPGI